MPYNKDVQQFQDWLNSKGQKVLPDGYGGPKTRQALLAAFANKTARAIEPADLARMAATLGGTINQLKAVILVEAGGRSFLDSGHPKILYERHYFWKRLRIKIPFLSDPAPGGYTLDADRDGINDSWEKLAEAACINPQAAFESCSWGAGQIMGAWWAKLGYASVFDFAWSMRESEAAHVQAMVRYIEKFGLKSAFQQIGPNRHQCTAFARGYNGPKQKGYDQKLAEAMR